jgi:rfaE bifunctional protein kinase chain/domain
MIQLQDNMTTFTSSRIRSLFRSFEDRTLIVIGDLMLDRYIWGRVDRISPEAPVPVVDVSREESRLGGAANVALNIHALGGNATLCGLCGQDSEGETLQTLAREKGFGAGLILPSSQRRSTVKVRIIGNQQQVLRVDKEDRLPLQAQEREAMLRLLLPQLDEFDALVFQDYDKGALDEALIQALTHAARQRGLPVLVDPKFAHFHAYAGCTLFKPNLKELNEGLGLRLDRLDLTGVQQAVAELRQRMPHQLTLVTLSENGILLVDEALEAHHLPAHRRDIVDVSGAGDTVIGVVALGLAAQQAPTTAAHFANLAGGLVCEEVGVVPIDRAKLLRTTY